MSIKLPGQRPGQPQQRSQRRAGPRRSERAGPQLQALGMQPANAQAGEAAAAAAAAAAAQPQQQPHPLSHSTGQFLQRAVKPRLSFKYLR
jgi:hypothetical protein